MGSIIVDVIIVLLFLIFTYAGYRKGLTGILFKIATFIVSLIIVFFLYKPVTNFLVEKTKVGAWFNQQVINTLSNTKVELGEELTEEDTNMAKPLRNMVNSLVKDAVKNTQENVVDYVSEKIAYVIIEILVIIALLSISQIALSFIKSIAEFIAKLPILHAINKAGGIFLGAIKGIVVIYIILAILSIISPMISESEVIKSINGSKIGSKLYNNNLLISIVTGTKN